MTAHETILSNASVYGWTVEQDDTEGTTLTRNTEKVVVSYSANGTIRRASQRGNEYRHINNKDTDKLTSLLQWLR